MTQKDSQLTFTFDGEPYTFDPGKMMVVEGIELKKFTGYTYTEWIEEIQRFDAEAFRFLVWVTLARAGRRPEGKYSAFDFDMGAVMATFSVENGDDPDEVEPDPTPARAASGSKKRSSSTAR
jgi:hypothetical protein